MYLETFHYVGVNVSFRDFDKLGLWWWLCMSVGWLLETRTNPSPWFQGGCYDSFPWFSKNQTYNHGFHKSLKFWNNHPKNCHWAIVHRWLSLKTHPYVHVIHTKRPKINLSPPFYHHIKPFDSHIKIKTNSHFHIPGVPLLIYSSSIFICHCKYSLYTLCLHYFFVFWTCKCFLCNCFCAFGFCLCDLLCLCVLHLSLIYLCCNFFVCASRLHWIYATSFYIHFLHCFKYIVTKKEVANETSNSE